MDVTSQNVAYREIGKDLLYPVLKSVSISSKVFRPRNNEVMLKIQE